MVVAPTAEGLTTRLGRTIVEATVVPRLHADVIAQAWADTVAVAVAAVHERGLQDFRRTVLGAESGAPWIGADAARPDDAALLNGAAAHYLDYDDISPTMPLHPSAVLVPAIMAAAVRDGELRFDRFADAYNIGAATLRFVTDSLRGGHYARGWHSTATAGRLAGVAAIARYRRVAPEIATNALALASSLASGSRANFGTTTKPIHAGLAARDALHAIDWSVGGVTASRTELEARSGFFARFGDAGSRDVAESAAAVAEEIDGWLERWPKDWGIKLYPSCYATHRAIEAALELRDRVPAHEVSDIEVRVYRGGTAPLILRAPETGTEAKFSLGYCVALAWLHGGVGLLDFTPSGFAARPEVLEFAERVVAFEDPEETADFAELTVVSRTGAAPASSTVTTMRSTPTADEVRAKIQDCCDFAAVEPAGASRLLAAAEGLEPDADLFGIIDGLRAREGAANG